MGIDSSTSDHDTFAQVAIQVDKLSERQRQISAKIQILNPLQWKNQVIHYLLQFRS